MRKALLMAFGLLLIGSPVLAEMDNWQIDPSHSRAQFSVRHMMISNVRGDFSKLKGSATYDGKKLGTASVQATIDASSIDTREPRRDTHLKSADFLNTDKYPTINFVSSKIENTKNGFKVYGNLTMHGITKPVVLEGEGLGQPIKDPMGKYRLGAVARTKVNRKDFGISFNKTMDNGGALVGDDVSIELDVELVKQS